MYSEFRLQKLSSRGLCQIIAILAPVIIGLFVHGMHVNRLGLYWDDGVQFMQGWQAADGNIIRFILSDTFGYLRAERPVAHFLMMIHRAAFAFSLSALHWSLVVLLVLNAVVLEIIALRIVKEHWFVFAVGIIFLTYPFAPLHVIWPATAHYLWACLLALLTILFSDYGLRATGMQRLTWYALAAITYMASLLTHEVFALIPPAFVSLWVLSKNGQNAAEWYHLGQISLYRPALWWLSVLVGVFGVYGLWRVLILPMYGASQYPSSMIELNPIMLAKKILVGVEIVFNPWPPVLKRIALSPPPLTYVFVSTSLFTVVWLLTLWLLRRSPVNDHPDRGDAVHIPSGDHWAQAAIIGIACLIAAAVAIAVSPTLISMDTGMMVSLRVNFVATVGVALALPALFVLLVRFYHRSPTLAGVVALVGLIYIGFIGAPKADAIFSQISGMPVLFGRYNLAYGSLLMAYVLAVIFVTIMTVLSFARHKPRGTWRRGTYGEAAVMPHSHACLLSGAVAGLVLLGTLFHFSIKEELATEWRQHTTMLEQLRTLAPAVKDNTFIVIVRHEPGRSPFAPYGEHWSLSPYFLVLYDNWTIIANTDQNLRFYADGVESTYWGAVATWFPPGVKGGPTLTHAKLPIPRIGYDRLLLFAFDGSKLRMLPQLEAKTTLGDAIIVHNNPDRILDRMTPRTAVWRHLIDR